MPAIDEVFALLRNTLTDIKDVDEDDIRLESTLEEIALDSLDYVELQLAIKKQYGVVINQASFMDGSLLTVGDFCQTVVAAESSLGGSLP